MSAPRYRFPVRFVVGWLGSMVLGRRRHLGADGERLLAERGARGEGHAHIPTAGPYLVVMNHYERSGLGVWWPALLVARELRSARGSSPELHWLVTDRFYRFRAVGLPVPEALVSWALRRVGARYALLMVARRPRQELARALALRRARRMLERGGVIASTPEGEHGEGMVLRDPVPTSGMSIAWLSRDRVPVLPVAAYEQDGQLVVVFGPTFTVAWPGLAAARARRDELAALPMRHVAGMMPAELRGPFDTEGDGRGSTR